MESFDDTKKWDDEHTNSPMITNSKLEMTRKIYSDWDQKVVSELVEEKTDEGVLVGYSLNSKAFKKNKANKMRSQKKLIIVQEIIHEMEAVPAQNSLLLCNYGLLYSNVELKSKG
ncbi:hypothetical protein Tco_0339538 [Tanacetum coccineum]